VKSHVKLPKLGDTAASVVIAEWLVEVGDRVEAGQPLVLVDTDKVTTEVPAPMSGTITEILVWPDDEIGIGQHLCIIDS
jgi:pyruvate/2-oxoglutarate dehydrogenase complex dihydrolipoamide acyltransferase (E2) component